MFGQLHVNEAMVQNTATITDNFNQYDDWIEIYNSSASAIDLAGYYLTDDPTNLDKHEILSGNSSLTTVPANGYLIFWADEDGLQGINHLNFRISDQETILLVDPNGQTIISTLTLPNLKDDESYGRILDGSANSRIFDAATPLQSNSLSLDTDITFSEDSKAFVGILSLSLSTSATGGVLRFTTNGTNPSSTSSIYTGPITLDGTTIVKAAYFFNNGSVSVIESERYVLMANALANTSSDLPIVMVHTYNQELNENDALTSFISVIEPNNNGRAVGGDEPSFAGRVAMKIRGASSSNFAKKQWRVEVQNEDGSDRDVSLLGMPSDSDWILYAPGRFDRALINNALMYEMSRRLGRWAPRCQFVEVYYNEGNTLGTGDYWGIYILMENIKVDNNRLDINEIDSTDNSGDALTGGYLFSLDREEDIVTPYTINYYGHSNIGYELRSPDSDEITNTQLSFITNTITDFENSLTASDWLDPNTGYKTKTNIDSWMVPHLFRALTKEVDGFHLSHFMIKDRNELLEAGPIWDFDRAINSTDRRSQDFTGWDTDDPNIPKDGNVFYWKGGVNAGAYINQMVDDPDYETLIYDSWFDWRRQNNVLDLTKINALIDSLSNELIESQARDFNRWGANDPNYKPRFGGFAGEIAEMKTWLANRANWMDGEFLPFPSFSPESSTLNQNASVTLGNTIGNGNIYYTTDGSDPRLPGGSISPTAIQYIGPIQFQKQGLTFITARIRTASNTWGAICTQEYYVAEDYSGLVINEIHYNPNDEIVNGDTISGRNFEFIELKNCGTTPINLNGIDFIMGGVDLDIQDCLIIQPDDFVVFAEDEDWFIHKFGFAPDAEYGEQLANGGELLFLVDPLDQLIDSVRYDDGPPWPGTADRGFYSLALRDCSLDNTLAASWAIQSQFTTPNAENFFTDFGEHGFSGIVINEIHYNPFDGVDNSGNVISGTNYEFVELKNITTAPIDLSDVFFSRGIDYFFPDNTIIQPGAFIVLAENATRFQERYGFAPFDSYGGRLSNQGEALWLSLESGPLLDAVTYDESFPWDTGANGGAIDYSLALIDGTVNNNTRLNWRVQCNSIFTPGAENDLGCFPGYNYNGLVINEIHYAPAQGNPHEFIELTNNSNLLIDLDQIAFSDGVSYVFNSQFIFPGQQVIIAKDSALFVNTYGVTPIGEYIGGLSSNGERLELIDLFGETIDEVTYGVSAPWASEPLQGNHSLSLINPGLNNNLAQSWCIQPTGITPAAANVLLDSDNDTVVDCFDTCPNLPNNLIGQSCNDGDPCTVGEMYDNNCGCSGGVFSDSDNDGVCDAFDQCQGLDDSFIGQSCEDGDPCTVGEIFNTNCQCLGGVSGDSDNDGICDALDQCDGVNDAIIGTNCNDGDLCTTGETYDSNCGCSGGTIVDSDNDGVCDLQDQCPGVNDGLIGLVCNDGDPCTVGDVYDSACNCQGTISGDADNDGVCDVLDTCPGFDNNLIGTPCDDGILCFIGSTWDNNCNCTGGFFSDVDNDNVCDPLDQCPGFDDDIDANNNGIPDGCEGCPDFINENSQSQITTDRSASVGIETNGWVPSNADIEYNAGQRVELLLHFEVRLGAVFHASIAPCN